MTQSDESHGEVLKASTPGAEQIEIGMDVLGVDGQNVGRVKEVRANDFLLDRPVARDLYVPYQVIMTVQRHGEKPVKGNALVLNVSAAHLDSQGWEHP